MATELTAVSDRAKISDPSFQSVIPTVRISLHQFSFENLVRKVGDAFDQGIDIVQVKALGTGLDVYCFRHPAHIRTILTDPATAISKVPTMLHRVKWVMGEGTFNALDPEVWKRRRTAMAPAFKAKDFLGSPEEAVPAVDSMSAEWLRRSYASGPFDLYFEMRRLVADYSLRGLFSHTSRDGLDKIVDAGIVLEDAFANWTPIWFPTPLNYRFLRGSRYVRGFFAQLIKERQASQDRQPDLLSYLVTLGESQTDPWTLEELVEECLSTYFGANAMASPLTWAVYLTAKHPHVYERLMCELTETINDRAPDVKDLGSLPYLEAVLDETMRVYPPFWVSPPRMCTGDIEIGGHRFAKGSTLVAVRYFAQRHPDFWNDPEAFYPERFLTQHDKQRHPFASLPFGGGPRMCLGRFLAPVVSRLVLARLFQHWRFQTVCPVRHEAKLEFSFGLYPRDRLMIKAWPRTDR
jgi:cytochrome P450